MCKHIDLVQKYLTDNNSVSYGELLESYNSLDIEGTRYVAVYFAARAKECQEEAKKYNVYFPVRTYQYFIGRAVEYVKKSNIN